MSPFERHQYRETMRDALVHRRGRSLAAKQARRELMTAAGEVERRSGNPRKGVARFNILVIKDAVDERVAARRLVREREKQEIPLCATDTFARRTTHGRRYDGRTTPLAACEEG